MVDLFSADDKDGAFARALEAFRHLKKMGQKVGLRLTLTRHNIADLPGLFRLIEREGIDRADFDRVRFWKVKGDVFPCPGGPCAGRWQSPHHVYIADRWVDHAALVKHEMLHDLLRTGDHPVAIFGVAGCNVLWDVPRPHTAS